MTGEGSLYVRVDASVERGIGHFVRCLSLAQYWRDSGRDVVFIGSLPDALVARLEGEGIRRIPIQAPHPDRGDLDSTLRAIPRAAMAVLDGYHFDPGYQAVLDTHCRLLVIDDTGHLPSYFGYALLNQNLDAHRVAYREAPRRRLLGLDYVLLGRAIRERRGEASAANDGAPRVVVSMGGSDAGNFTATALQAIRDVGRPGLRVRVLVGPLNPHRASLEQFGGDGVELVDSPGDVGEHLAWASVVIAAAGSTSWEIAAMRRPSILVATADNQVPVGRAMEAHRGAMYLGETSRVTPAVLAAATRELLEDAPRLAALASAAGRLVDGEGVERVTRVLRGEDQ